MDKKYKIEDQPVIDVLTLRDFFAAVSLIGIRASNFTGSEKCSHMAYEDADAMLHKRISSLKKKDQR